MSQKFWRPRYAFFCNSGQNWHSERLVGGLRGGPWWFALIENFCGMTLSGVWKVFELISVHLRKLLFCRPKIPKANPPLFHFRSGLVRRNLRGDQNVWGVAWIFRLGSFLLKCSPILYRTYPFEFAPFNYFGKSRGKIESTISAL